MTEVHGINIFTIREEDEQTLVDALASIGTLDSVPGLRSLQLLREVGGSRRLINHMCWESVEHYQLAAENPSVAAAVAKITDLVQSGDPGFFELIHAQQ
jgi:heme-degrading monooxygenase HmoA